MLYNSGLVKIPGEYINTFSYPMADGTDFKIIEIRVPGYPMINVALDTYFITNDTRENEEVMVNGHIGG